MISDPYKDIEKFSDKSYCQFQILSGNKSGEAIEIEEFKVYHALMNLFDKEI